LAQIARIDLVILRIGLYELSFAKDVPPKVVINEAVELAKAFGSENSSKFINGVLGTALRNLDSQRADKPNSKQKV
jgi:N utilization substance protein B